VSDQAVYMLNVLWFKKEGGAEKYGEYMEAAGPFVAALGAELEQALVPEQAVIGEWDADLVFVVKWPNWESFLKLAEDPAYLAIAHLREEAIDNSLLIRCRPA